MQDTARSLKHPEAALSAPLAEIAVSASAFARDAKAANTRRAYAGDWRRFAAFCSSHDLAAFPSAASSVLLYLTAMADSGYRATTIQRARSSNGFFHRVAGEKVPGDDARVREVMAGIRRRLGVAPNQAAALLPVQLRAMVRRLPDNARGARDAAMLTLGFAGAFRRSELVALDVSNVEFVDEGLVVGIAQSKTDQEGDGAKLGVPFGNHAETCPVLALRTWLAERGNAEGPLFLEITRWGKVTQRRASCKSVYRAVKRAASAAGLDPSSYSAHSLRAGLATAAARAGKTERAIMRHGRWRSRTTVDRYVRDGTLFEENAANEIGL